MTTDENSSPRHGMTILLLLKMPQSRFKSLRQ